MRVKRCDNVSFSIGLTTKFALESGSVIALFVSWMQFIILEKYKTILPLVY